MIVFGKELLYNETKDAEDMGRSGERILWNRMAGQRPMVRVKDNKTAGKRKRLPAAVTKDLNYKVSEELRTAGDARGKKAKSNDGYRRNMETKVLERLKMEDRKAAVSFLKSLWGETPQSCPLCGGKLEHFHKKAKKSNCDWICTGCGERFDTIKILKQLNEN